MWCRTVLRLVVPDLDVLDKDRVDAARLAEVMCPHIKQPTKVCAEEANQFLIEGFEVAPSYPARLRGALAGTTVRAWSLGHSTFSGADLAAYRGPRPQHEADASRAELEDTADWIRQRIDQVREECPSMGCPSWTWVCDRP